MPDRTVQDLCAEAGAELVDPGLIRLPLPTPTLPPATTTNHYFAGNLQTLLVDPATPDRRGLDRLVALAQALAGAGWRLQGLLLTHHHGDHVAAAGPLAQRLGLPVLAHALTAERLAGTLNVDRQIQDGEAVATDRDGARWLALHTPGHAPGHLVLINERRRGVVAGDMVAGEGTILVDPRDGSMAEYLDSLMRIATLQPAYLAPAHGPVLHDAQAVLAYYRKHRLEREARVLQALPPTWTAPDALLPTAYADVSRLAWPLALRSILAHLEHLAQQGQAERQGDLWRRISG